MTTLQQVLAQVAELDEVEQEELAFALAAAIQPSLLPFTQLRRRVFAEYPSIVRTPGVCGGAARLIRTRISIWVLEQMRRLGIAEVDILRSFPTLRAIDLVQAWSYAARFREEIEQAIQENEEA